MKDEGEFGEGQLRGCFCCKMAYRGLGRFEPRYPTACFHPSQHQQLFPWNLGLEELAERKITDFIFL